MPAAHEGARIAALTRHKGADHPDTIDAKRDHAAAAIADEIGRRLAADISLTDPQIAELTALLHGAARPIAELQASIDDVEARIDHLAAEAVR